MMINILHDIIFKEMCKINNLLIKDHYMLYMLNNKVDNDYCYQYRFFMGMQSNINYYRKLNMKDMLSSVLVLNLNKLYSLNHKLSIIYCYLSNISLDKYLYIICWIKSFIMGMINNLLQEVHRMLSN